ELPEAFDFGVETVLGASPGIRHCFLPDCHAMLGATMDCRRISPGDHRLMVRRSPESKILWVVLLEQRLSFGQERRDEPVGRFLFIAQAESLREILSRKSSALRARESSRAHTAVPPSRPPQTGKIGVLRVTMFSTTDLSIFRCACT